MTQRQMGGHHPQAGIRLRRWAAAALLAATGIVVPAGASRVAHAASAPECTTGVLHATIGATQGAAGSVFTTLVLRNIGHAACFVHGYPGVSLVGSTGRQIGRAATRTPATAKRVVLRSGQAASTVIHTLNPGVGTTKCLAPSAAVRVYPPDQRTSLRVKARLSECLDVLEVRPLVAGTAGM